MKKISRRSFITAMAAVSAAGVLAACGSSSSSTASSVASSAVSSEATSSAASMDETGTHTVVDHGGNEVEVPNKVTRVVIDQIPILSTYMAYFEGSAPYIVGYCGSFKSVISDTVLKNIAPELLESSDTVYAQSDLNIEEIMKLNPDVILYNAGNSSHAEILKASGIPSIGFATVGASTEADPIERYEEWLKLLEQIFNEPGKTDAFVAAGDEIVTDVEARIAEIPQTDRPSALILWKYADGVPQVSGQGTFGTYWMKRLGVTDKALEATGFAQASMEQIYSWDPDILFLDGPGLQPLRTEDVLSGNVDGADFSTLTAVKSGRVYNTTLGIIIIYLLRWRLNILSLSDDEARASGINIKQTRMLFIVASTLVTASAVSMCGQVGWIGLLIPHASRMLVGSNNRYVVPLSLSLGASFMILIDTLSRSISIIELPLSILTAIIGAPAFISLLNKTRSNLQ